MPDDSLIPVELIPLALGEEERIDIDDFNDLRYWSNRFNVAKWRIREAVLEVGNNAAMVEARLGRGAFAHQRGRLYRPGAQLKRV